LIECTKISWRRDRRYFT